MTTKLVQMYADCNNITTAILLFDKLPQPNVFTWTAILSFYSRNGMPNECIRTYRQMKSKGTLPDKYVFPKVIRATAQSLCLEAGIQVHKEVITFGAELNLQVCNSLIDMYSKCGDVRSARRVFDVMVEKRYLLSWNSMISGYVSNGFLTLAVEFFGYMKLIGLEPDTVTFNTAMDAYCRMGQCDEAWKIFGQIREPNIISWTTLISGYSRIGKHEVTLAIFRNMCEGGVFPDLDCLSSALVSCRHRGELRSGQEIHAYGIKTENGLALYESAGPALLTMYSRCKRTQDATNVFKLMDKSDVVTWNAMIHGFSDLGIPNSALECFRTMQIEGVRNDQTTISTILPECDLKSGKQIHAYIRKSGFSSVIPVWNALIHMYSKCGCINIAYSVFSNMESRDIVSYNAMIGGFGKHGLGQVSLQLLHDMIRYGLSPNSLTFTSLLSACSHSGLVREGLKLFNRMSKDFGFNPRREHFACVVDLLARAGQLEDAVGFIERMPIEPDKCIWGAVLAASRAHQNIDAGMLASENLVFLEPENAGHYVTLSNMYARDGRWDDAVRVRELMESRKLVKPSGYSWIERGDQIHEN